MGVVVLCSYDTFPLHIPPGGRMAGVEAKVDLDLRGGIRAMTAAGS